MINKLDKLEKRIKEKEEREVRCGIVGEVNSPLYLLEEG